MSYDIYAINKNNETLIIDHHNICGGTYAIGGINEAYFNITCNYSKYFYKYIDKKYGIKSLDGSTVISTIKILNNAINKLKNDINSDYWECTEGNTKQALINLRELALLVLKVDTEAIWKVSC